VKAAALAAAPLPPTVVTFTFDDGNADTVAAASVLNAAGMHGTYYTNSGTIGLPGYQTRSDLSALLAAGNEIAGHTVSHPDLTTLSSDAAKRQICLDRDTLLGWGFPVQNFAYPFAATNASVDALAQACGYNSARNLGDIQSKFGCAGCPFAESIPPVKPYELAALDEVDATWTLADLESTVTNAQSNGGGWVILTFHHLCDSGCDSLAVTPALFSQFVSWLSTQSANNTAVETVAQVIGGTTQPAVVVPPATSSASVTNPSFETTNTTTNLPDCWAQAGFGTNTATYDTVSPGHTGNVAARLTMSAYTDGDSKVMPLLDLGTCAPSAIAGASYQLSAWYTSTANTQFEVYLRTTTGGWVYWDASPYFAPATAWSPATWVTQPVPAGYDGIDFGLTLFSLGTLVTDDYSLTSVAAALTTTALVSPATPNGTSNWYISQPTVTLTASNTGVATTTQYSLDAGTTWLTYTAPVTIAAGTSTFSYRSTTATQTEATHTLPFTVDVDLPIVTASFNDTTRTFSASATDATSGVAAIQYRTPGGAWTTYTVPTTIDNGSIALEFRAVDVAGNISASVNISEGAITTAIVSPSSADGLSGWYVTPPTVTLSAGTPGTDQVTQYSYDGIAWSTYSAPIIVPDGIWTLYYRTTGAGHTEATQTLAFSVDSTAPVVTASFDSTTRTYSAGASDAASGVASIQQSISGGSWTTYTGPTVIGAASLSLAFRATDVAGNVSASVPLAIGAITTASVSPASPNGLLGWYTVAPVVTLSAGTPPAGQVTQYSFNGTTWVTYTDPITIPSGLSTLSYRTVGAGITEATNTLPFSVDLDSPQVSPVFDSGTRTWSATATDVTSGIASIQVRIPGGAWSPYTAPVSIGNGSLSLEFQATDIAGHASAVVALTAGAITTASVSPASPNGAAGWYKTAPVVTLSVSGTASLGSPSSGQVTQYSFTGLAWSTYTAPITIPNGTTTFSYRTIGAGTTEATRSLTLMSDTVAPHVTATFHSSTRTATATASDSGSGVASISWRVAGGNWATYAGPVHLGRTAITLQFRATDVAGLVSTVASLSVPKGSVRSAAAITLKLSPSTVAYLHSPSARISVVSGGKPATGDITILVSGKPYATIPLSLGQAMVPLSNLISAGRHTVVAEYQDGLTNAAGASAPAAMTVTKAPTSIKLSKVSSTVDPTNRTIQVKVAVTVRIVGSALPPQGKVVIVVNGHIARIMTLTAANAGSVTVTLPAFSNKTRAATIRAYFVGTANLKPATTSSMVMRLV
jgi:peptidoglycan/xylan/chitin deacetylase (PgdA/CDA1 family)